MIKRVVVTRPERSGTRTAALLRERGYEPVLLPLTRPSYKAGAIERAFRSNPAALAITSAEALRAVQSSNIDLSAFFAFPLFAVGATTAKAAREMGFHKVLTGEGNGYALARLVLEKYRATTDGTLLYLAGTPRDGGFEEALSASPIRLEIAEVYEMQAVGWQQYSLQALLQPPADAVLLYSKDTARIFFELVASLDSTAFLQHSAFVCMSEKVRSAVPEHFRQNAYASPAPVETVMFELLARVAGT